MFCISNSIIIIGLDMSIWKAPYLFGGTEDLRENHGRTGKIKDTFGRILHNPLLEHGLVF